MKKIKLFILMLLLSVLNIYATKVVWDGESGDNKWNTASNWNPDGVPVTADSVYVGNNATVLEADINFAYLEVEVGATVENKAGTAHPQGSELKIAGTLDKPGAQAIRFQNNTVLELSGTLGGGVPWAEFNASTLSLIDGAAIDPTVNNIQFTGNTGLDFTLSATGFTTVGSGDDSFGLNPGGGSNWSNVTINIDMSAYTGDEAEIVLMDFSSHDAVYDGTFNPTVSINDGGRNLGYSLSFSTANSTLLLSKPVIVEWTGGAADGLWGTATNWSSGEVPDASTQVLISGNATVTGATNTFGSLEVESGSSVTFNENINGSRVVDLAGVLDRSGGVLRIINQITVNLASSGVIGGAITWLDINNSSVNFVDGAAFSTSVNDVEMRVGSSFGFTLSSTGFATLGSGDDMFRLQNGGIASWADLTINVDISDYNLTDQQNGDTIILMDFNDHNAIYDGTFNPTINIETGSSNLQATLSFDVTESQLVLDVESDTPTQLEESTSNINVYAYDNKVVIDGKVNSYQLFDMQGRAIEQGQGTSDFTEIMVDRGGVYIVGLLLEDNTTMRQKVLLK